MRTRGLSAGRHRELDLWKMQKEKQATWLELEELHQQIKTQQEQSLTQQEVLHQLADQVQRYTQRDNKPNVFLNRGHRRESYQATSRREPKEWWHCREKGHYRRDCPVLKEKLKRGQVQGFGWRVFPAVQGSARTFQATRRVRIPAWAGNKQSRQPKYGGKGLSQNSRGLYVKGFIGQKGVDWLQLLQIFHLNLKDENTDIYMADGRRPRLVAQERQRGISGVELPKVEQKRSDEVQPGQGKSDQMVENDLPETLKELFDRGSS